MSSESNSDADIHALDYWQIIRNRYGIILLAFFLVFMTACVVTYILPRKYEGRVQLQIESDNQEIVMTRNQPGSFGRMDPRFIETEFKIIESNATLEKVIERLGLIQRWGLSSKLEAIGELKKSLNTDEVRGTSLIDIVVLRTDKDEAAEIANEIADAYQERRLDVSAGQADRALATLDRELKSQQDRVEKARVKMLDIMVKNNIVDTSSDNGIMGRLGGSGDIASQQRQQVGDVTSRKLEAEAQIQTIENQIAALQGKTGQQLIDEAAALQLTDSTISILKPEFDRLDVELQQLLASGYGKNHPQVKTTEAALRSVASKLESGVRSLRSVLATNLAIARQSLASVDDLKDRTEANAIASRQNNVDYQEAKKDYQMQEQLFGTMSETFISKRVDIGAPKNPMLIHQRAEANPAPASPNIPLNLALGAVVGLAFGVGLAFFLEYLDTSVKSLEDVERYLEVPVLAVIPKDVGVLHKQSGISPDAEAYRILRTNIEFNRKSADANAITVVSGGAGEGKSTTLVNLAYVCAQGGYNTLMIDGDLRRPKLHTFFDINNSVGLTNYLTTELQLEDVILQTPIDNLYFMPSGILPADAAGILNSRRMSELIADVKSRFDLVLIDSPPILGVSDASVLASEVDLTMIVIQHRKLPRSMLMRVKQAVENVGGNLLGVVLNNVDVRSDSQYQYYTSYYTYYSPTNAPSAMVDVSAAGGKSTSKSAASASAATGDDY